MSKQDKLANLLNRSGWLTKRWTEGQDVNEERKDCNKEIAEVIFPEEDEDEDLVDWKPNFPDRAEILKTPIYNELRIHYMCLAGWGYRNIDEHPSLVHQQIYEVARRTRIAGAKYLRSFLMNGSRKPNEKYIMDALPWKMVIKNGRKIIDFDSRNVKYWEVVKIIEQACMYWGIQHKPTFWMERYNDDIFNRDNNVQKIHGFWTDETVPVKVAFMREFMNMQKVLRNPTFLSPFEFINEPLCWGNHDKGAIVADHHLDLWRGVEDLTEIRRAMTCSGGCDFAHANFVEKQKHWFDGRYYGSYEFKDRAITADFHGASTLQSLYNENFEHGLGSAWKHLSFNEDGSDSGSYSPIPWTPFRLANAAELYDMQYHGHTESRKRNKKFFHTVFMLDRIRRII
ncbi:MAG: hypothetical protein JRI26_11920 [Deltaproteobacteria bacterium]|nr:hypothetical protein [Deltaproteobacteria bacterium]